MNFKEALIAHLRGEKVECREGCGYSWQSFARYFGGTTLANLEKGTFDCFQFRLAPRTIFVNGVEVPAPEKVEPKEGCFVYVADPTSNLHHFTVKWVSTCEQYIEYLQRGLVYLNKEYAISRAKAMFFSEPTIIADTMPAKKPSVPKLKFDDGLMVINSHGKVECYGYVEQEFEDSVAMRTGEVYEKAYYNFFKLGEEIKWEN